MNRFDYYEPKTIKEACKLCFNLGNKASLLAGGTDLIPKLKQKLIKPKAVVNLKKIKGLDFVKPYGKSGLSLGTLTHIADIAVHPLLQKRFPVLCVAARTIGSTQVRNLATLGGNLCNASPSADMVPGLLVLDAKVKVAGPSGNREIPLEELFAGPGKMNLAKGEILTEVRIPFPSAHTRQIYLKHSIRRAMDIALVGVAVALSFDNRTKVCSKARVAFGAVAPTPVRAKKTEGKLVGKKIEEFSLESVGETAAEEVAPISDVRGSAHYRREMIKELTMEAIRRL